ncbi:MAG: hypothetical protein ACR2PZ_11505 [Pseudomonadales bacterium]
MRSVAVGETLPELSHCPDNVQLFFYNAALWNAHRIHYDLPYATEVEGYSGLVIAGPLMGDWLGQCLLGWMGNDGRLKRLQYSNRQAAYIGETLRSRGTVTAWDPEQRLAEVDVVVVNQAGEVITPGSATVEFL